MTSSARIIKHAAAVVCALLLAACVTREPSPAEVDARQFKTVAGKAVVYVYRDRLDALDSQAVIMLDGQMQGASYRASFFRFELAPGRHHLDGYAGDSGHFDFAVDAGGLYFIRHSLGRIVGRDYSVFRPAPQQTGRAAVLQYEMNNIP
jgi:hypothetical protein